VSPTIDAPLAVGLDAAGESQVRRFEAARAADASALTTADVPPLGHPGRAAVLVELVRIDLEFGWDAGRPTPLADYLKAFPDLAQTPSPLADIAFEEYRQRLAHGHPASSADYAAAYGVDTSDWPDADDSRPRTAVLDVASDVHSEDFQTVTADGVADAAQAYRQFRADPQSASVPFTGPGAAGLFRDLHATRPAAAQRLASGVAGFPEPGADFLGFRLVDELGRGAFARVYLARQGDLADRPVALKVSATLCDESQTLAQLQHTNIVPIYSVHTCGTLHAVCMPYFGATTLADIVGGLRKEGVLPGTGQHFISTLNNRKSVTRVDSRVHSDGEVPATAAPAVSNAILDKLTHYSYVEAVLWLAARIADGLAHAHARGIIHRDLKPANILLTDEGQPMLLDFNLADDTAAAPATKVGGTLPYMSPEHLDAFRGLKAPVDARSDLYALGLMLFELLAGHAPFPIPAGKISEVVPKMAAQRRAGPPPLRAVNPAVSPATEAIVLKLLAADPAHRYQSADALLDDLDRQLTARPLKYAPNPSLMERADKWTRRNPKLATVAKVAVPSLALMALLAVRAVGYTNRAHAKNEAFWAGRHQVMTELAVGVVDPTRLPETVADGKKALAPYGADADPAWAGRLSVTLLPAATQQKLKAAVAEVQQLTARAAKEAAERGVGDPAEADRLAALVGNAPLTLVGAAVELMKERQYKAALAPLGRAVEADPSDFDARFNRGVCLLRLARPLDAAADFEVCLAFDPDHVRARFNRGLVRLELKHYDLAAADFDRVIELRPSLADAYVNRALCRRDLGDPTGALADLTTALESGETQTRIYFLRSQVHAQLGDKAAEKADVAEGLKRTPKDIPSWIARAKMRETTDPAEAVSDTREAIRLDPSNPRWQVSLAGLLSDQLGRTADGIKVLDAVLGAHPGHAPALAGRAVLLARLGDRPAAHADADACLAADPSAMNHYQVAGVYALTSKQVPADRDRALVLLAKAFAAEGFTVDYVRADPELDPLRADPDFRALVAAAAKVRKTAAK